MATRQSEQHLSEWREEWAALPYTEDPRPWRHLACSMLLGAYLAAQAGDESEARWNRSQAAKSLADLVDMPYWPPKPDQQFSLDELAARSDPLGISAPIRHVSARPTRTQTRKIRTNQHNRLFERTETVTVTVPMHAVWSLWSAVQPAGVGG